jgi:hypothetical protein
MKRSPPSIPLFSLSRLGEGSFKHIDCVFPPAVCLNQFLVAVAGSCLARVCNLVLLVPFLLLFLVHVYGQIPTLPFFFLFLFVVAEVNLMQRSAKPAHGAREGPPHAFASGISYG